MKAKYLLGFLVVLLLVGCAPKSELEKAQAQLAAAQTTANAYQSELSKARAALEKTPADFVGLWRCQTNLSGHDILGSNTATAVEISVGLEAKGRGGFTVTHEKRAVESIIGSWVRAGEFIVIEGPNGFVGFKVASKTDTKMTLVNREGKILEFTKIK